MTPAEAMDVGSQLIHLLSQQQLIYRQLHRLTEKQGSLVSSEDPETLLRVLSGRQRLIDRLNVLDGELAPLRAGWQEIAASLPQAQQQQAQELIDSVGEILGEILAVDERDMRNLCRQKEKIARDIRAASLGKRMNRAYGQNNPAGANRYLDTKSV